MITAYLYHHGGKIFFRVDDGSNAQGSGSITLVNLKKMKHVTELTAHNTAMQNLKASIDPMNTVQATTLFVIIKNVNESS